MHACVWIYMYIYIYIYTHTYVHTHLIDIVAIIVVTPRHQMSWSKAKSATLQSACLLMVSMSIETPRDIDSHTNMWRGPGRAGSNTLHGALGAGGPWLRGTHPSRDLQWLVIWGFDYDVTTYNLRKTLELSEKKNLPEGWTSRAVLKFSRVLFMKL